MLAAATAGAVPSHAPSLHDLLLRLSGYVSAYGQQASAFVGTETYTQELTGPHDAASPTSRTTVAEFAIVRTSGSLPWVGFRDVVEVDGQAITDHRDRLLAILTAPTPDPDQARRLSEESARLNIGPIERNFNVPTSTLFFFTPNNLDRFTFKLARVEGSDLFRISFKETRTPTLIRTIDGNSVPSEGDLLVDADGVIHETILRLKGASNRKHAPIATTIDVQYDRIPGIDVWLPSLMTEEYVRKDGPSVTQIDTRAEYSNYRQFETSVKIR